MMWCETSQFLRTGHPPLSGLLELRCSEHFLCLFQSKSPPVFHLAGLGLGLTQLKLVKEPREYVTLSVYVHLRFPRTNEMNFVQVDKVCLRLLPSDQASCSLSTDFLLPVFVLCQNQSRRL